MGNRRRKGLTFSLESWRDFWDTGLSLTMKLYHQGLSREGATLPEPCEQGQATFKGDEREGWQGGVRAAGTRSGEMKSMRFRNQSLNTSTGWVAEGDGN